MKKLLLTLAATLAAGTLVCHAQAATASTPASARA